MARLAIVVLGNRRAGKSRTWKALFGRGVRTTSSDHELELGKDLTIRVTVINGSPHERGMTMQSILGRRRPDVLLCSWQYVVEARASLEFLVDNGYEIFIQWLNPGHHDASWYPDHLGLAQEALHVGATLSVRDGTTREGRRVDQIRTLLIGWAVRHRLRSSR
jgi:hypothetical protein